MPTLAYALAEHRAQLDFTASAANVGVWDWDLATGRLWLDTRSAGRLGIAAGEQDSVELLSRIVAADELPAFRAAVERALSATSVVSHGCRIGEERANIQMRVTRDSFGQPVRVLLIVAPASRSESDSLRVAVDAAELVCWEFSFLTKQFTWFDRLPAGMTPDEMGREFVGATDPDDNREFQAATHRALEAGQETMSGRVRRRDRLGRLRYIHVYQRFFRDADGQPLRALGVTRDITEEVQSAERLEQQAEQLREAQQRFERASLSVQEGHWELDVATGKHWASSNYYALLGYTAEDEADLSMLSKVTELIHPEDHVRGEQAATEHLQTGVPYDIELRVRTRDGSYRWFRLRANSQRDSTGQILRMAGSIQDIQKQKLAEDELQEAKARFERAIHGTQDGLFEADLKKGKIWLSPRLQELLGFNAGEMSDYYEVLRERVHPDDLASSDAAAIGAASGQALDFEVRMRTKAGAYRWYRMRGTPAMSGGQVHRVSGSLQDVTEAYEARQALIRASEAAQSANRAKSQFLANVSHEIRTPMNGIIGMTSLLLDTPLDATQLDFAQTIRASANSLLNVINDILDFSKIEAGKLDIESLDMSVRDTLDDVVAITSYPAAAKNLQLTADVHADVPAKVIGDPQRIRQCLVNLIGNAIKFTARGEIVCRVFPLRGAVLRFEVRDTGIGIAPETLRGLFQPFVQADASTTRHFGGTGLGLSIVRRLVEMMGGEVGAQSTPGAGSTFWFDLPLAVTLAAEPRPVASAPIRPAHFAARVLVVEDNIVNQKVAQRFLERLGCEVVLAVNGEEGVAAWQQGGFQLVLMDVQMPLMDGYSASRRIREIERGLTHIPIVALTANAMSGQLERCLEAGMDGLLTKPLAVADLQDVLQRFAGVQGAQAAASA